MEACLLSKIPSVFTPETVLKLDDSAVQAIAGESQESLTERESLTKKLLILKDTQKILHRLDRHKGNRKGSHPVDPPPSADSIKAWLPASSREIPAQPLPKAVPTTNPTVAPRVTPTARKMLDPHMGWRKVPLGPREAPSTVINQSGRRWRQPVSPSKKLAAKLAATKNVAAPHFDPPV